MWMTVFGASRALRRIPAKVGLRKRYRPLDEYRVDFSSCPFTERARRLLLNRGAHYSLNCAER